MLPSEIAEHLIKKYPDADIDVYHGYREDWYEEYLIDYLMDFFSFDILGLCGCGSQEDTQFVIWRYLTIRKRYFDERLSWNQVQELYKSELNIDTDNEMHYGLLQFLMYVLDDKGITAHGSGIGGAWLTRLGEMYLDVLNAWAKQEAKRL